jgi:hypothetical protein
MENKNTTIYINRAIALLWFNPIKKEVETDFKTYIKSEIGEKKISRAKTWVILLLKYFIPLTLVYLLNTFTWHFDSTLTLGLVFILYPMYFNFKYNNKRKSMIAVKAIIFFIFVVSAFYLHIHIVGQVDNNFKFLDIVTSDISYMFNYTIQYYIIITVLHNIYADIVNKAYTNYYTIEDNPLRYFKFENKTRDMSKNFKIFYAITLIAGLIFFLYGLADFLAHLVRLNA